MTLVVETAQLSVPAIAIHGGAGAFERVTTAEDEAELAAVMRLALEAGWRVLDGGGPAIDAVVEAVVVMEDSGRFNAGAGGSLTADGMLELDASVMDGSTGNVGGVCAAQWPRNPVRAARAVAGLGGPVNGPVLLAGVGADVFSKNAGLPQMVRGQVGVSQPTGGQPPVDHTHGTVGAVAVDKKRHLAAATSTGGREGQRPGRVGDSPIPGAGVWADDSTVALSATGEGEVFLVAGFAHLVDWSVREGARLTDAVVRSLAEVNRRGGSGGAIAVNAAGEFVFVFDTKAMARGLKDSSRTSVAVLDIDAMDAMRGKG